MAIDPVSLGASLQAGLQALKSSLQSEAAVTSLVQQAVETGKSAELASSSAAPATDPSRALDVIV